MTSESLELKKGLRVTQKTTSNRVTAGHGEECPKALLSFALNMSVFECFLLSWWCSMGEVVQSSRGRTGRRKWVAGGQPLRLRDKTYFISSFFAPCSRDMWRKHDRAHVSGGSQSHPAKPFPVMDSDDFEPQNQSEALCPSVCFLSDTWLWPWHNLVGRKLQGSEQWRKAKCLSGTKGNQMHKTKLWHKLTLKFRGKKF